MFESTIGDTLCEPTQKCVAHKTHWFQYLIGVFKKYKSEFFGAGDSEIRKLRMLDYTVKPSEEFVLAKYKDGFYRPARIAGKSKKSALFIVNFYHSKRCLYVKPEDIIVNHGNLLNFKVSFTRQSKCLKGVVYGNNSPANKGFPSMFYIKKKDKWHKVPVRMIFLTTKQFNIVKCSCEVTENTHNNLDSMDICCDECGFQKPIMEFDGDFEMS